MSLGVLERGFGLWIYALLGYGSAAAAAAAAAAAVAGIGGWGA